MSHLLGCFGQLSGFLCHLLLAPDDVICILLLHCFYYAHLFLRISSSKVPTDLWKRFLLLQLGPHCCPLSSLCGLLPCCSAVYTVPTKPAVSITGRLGVLHYSRPRPISLDLHMDSLLLQSYRTVGVRHHLHFLHEVSHDPLLVHSLNL